jgi:hypothetical protein
MTDNIIEVPLPVGMKPTDADIELLTATFQAIVALRYENCMKREAMTKVIEDNGWKVRWGLTWIAEARRGTDYEQATGKTTVDALGTLFTQTQMAKLEGCP